MNTKNYVYMFVVGLICAVALTAQPLYAEVSQVVDEAEKTVPKEEVIEIPAPQDISTPTHQTNTEEQTVVPEKQTEEPENIQTPTEETKAEEPEPTEEVVQTVQPKEDKPKETVEVEQPKQTTEKPDCIKILKSFGAKVQKSIWNTIASIKDYFKNLASNPIFNKWVKQSPDKKQPTTCLEVAPYYLINPPFNDDYLKKIVFDEKIVNIAEFMPYSLSVKNLEVKIEAPKNTVTPQGTTDIWVLVNAPSPQITVKGKSLFAKLVIDIRNNTLYKYDKDGFPLKAYLVATGARGTRTMPGLRVVTYKEKFPYAGAPESKRALDPYSYGPYILFLNAVEPRTGRQYCVEQLLHGNGNEYSIGRKVSHGCVRTNNTVMRRELSKEVKRGDYILLINPDVD